MNAAMLNLEALPLSDEQFYQLCQGNPEKQLEMTAAGELVIMAQWEARVVSRRLT